VSALCYRGGWKSDTFKLVVLVFLVCVALLAVGKLTGAEFVNIVLYVVGGWVARDGATKAAEAWRDRATAGAARPGDLEGG